MPDEVAGPQPVRRGRGDHGDGLRVGVAGAGPVAVRCRAVEVSRDPADVLADVRAVDDAVAPGSYREQVLPILVGRVLREVGAA